MSGKKDVRKLSLKELKEYFQEKGRKPFRAKQVYEWIWIKGATSFDFMTNLSKEDREMLSEDFCFQNISKKEQQESKDGTAKISFELHDGHIIESVYIPSAKRTTACISSQVGCHLNCTFCATGTIPFKRNLSAAEIFDQLVTLNNLSIERKGTNLTNIVYMGMGEPLLNYEEVLKSIDLITAENGWDFSPRRITISTVGLPDQIRKLADDQVKFNLAISLHSANDKVRSKLVPVNKKYNLEKLKNAIKYYHKKTENRITFEYLMLGGVNDSIEDAKELAEYCKNFPVKVNLIEYNPNSGMQFKKSDPEDTEKFREFLESKNMIVNIRRSRGKDIDAACGQLADKKEKQ